MLIAELRTKSDREKVAMAWKVSVVVPVYNEPGSLLEVLERLLLLSAVTEIVVVDDGSSDDTLKWVKDIIDPRIVLLRHERNRGKGAAIRTAIGNTTGNVIVIQDADLEYAPEEIPRLLEPIVSGEAEVVYGTRFPGGNRQSTLLSRFLANRLLTKLSNLFTGYSLSDMETGHKVFRRETLQGMSLKEDRFGFEPEVTARLARRKAKIVEIPVPYAPRSYVEGKKIGYKDGLRAIWCIFRYSLWD